MDRILDAMLQASGGPPDGFQALCRALARSSGGTLAAELEAELGLERGVVKPRPEMILEAEALVNRLCPGLIWLCYVYMF